MNLSHAPADQLEQARVAIELFKLLNIPYDKIYTSWNSKRQLVRVKFYNIPTLKAKKACKIRDIGFVDYRTSFSKRVSALGFF